MFQILISCHLKEGVIPFGMVSSIRSCLRKEEEEYFKASLGRLMPSNQGIIELEPMLAQLLPLMGPPSCKAFTLRHYYLMANVLLSRLYMLGTLE
jgi:hypothetical protein